MGRIVSNQLCAACATPRDPKSLLCVECGGSKWTVGRAKPSIVIQDHALDLPYPWTTIHDFPPNEVICIAGPPGSGKSSLCAMLCPDLWLTSEQTVKVAASMFARFAVPMPDIVQLGQIRDPRTETGERRPDTAALPTLEGVLSEAFAVRMVVVDSLSKLGGPAEQLDALDQLMQWVRRGEDRRAIVILAWTKGGDFAGPKQIPHMCHAEIVLDGDDEGRRVFSVPKNRGGPLGSSYFIIQADGVTPPPMPYAYSVEGSPGRYRLDAYPSKSAKWDGPLHAMREARGAVVGGIACAARCVPGYPDGLLRPADESERRAFAEMHGLTWHATIEDLDQDVND